ncbi:ribonuclease domain-containing protein [Sinomonas flava]|uniref:Uncharacterized protein n=1 Tax=Sinomonas flava TaxID=496857 RepID=A0ABP5NXE7_9MICC
MSPALRRLLVAAAVLAVAVAASFLLRAAGDTTAGAGAAPSSVASPSGSASPAVRPSSPAPQRTTPPAAARSAVANPSGLAEVRASQLPREARETLALIAKGGPYPYERDGVVFGNFEGILPSRQRGYYHEYTVPTPGEADRGARRIVAGDGGDTYYTDDHYESFRFILEDR